MKLILCKKCQDVFKLQKKTRYCKCKESYGKYLDNLNAIYHGPCIPIGFSNSSLLNAIRQQSYSRESVIFEAFTIPEECYTFKRTKE